MSKLAKWTLGVVIKRNKKDEAGQLSGRCLTLTTTFMNKYLNNLCESGNFKS